MRLPVEDVSAFLQQLRGGEELCGSALKLLKASFEFVDGQIVLLLIGVPFEGGQPYVYLAIVHVRVGDVHAEVVQLLLN